MSKALRSFVSQTWRRECRHRCTEVSQVVGSSTEKAMLFGLHCGLVSWSEIILVMLMARHTIHSLRKYLVSMVLLPIKGQQASISVVRRWYLYSMSYRHAPIVTCSVLVHTKHSFLD